LIGPGPGRQDGQDVEELGEASAAEEVAAWRRAGDGGRAVAIDLSKWQPS
jgi:hypothetical protein